MHTVGNPDAITRRRLSPDPNDDSMRRYSLNLRSMQHELEFVAFSQARHRST
jgi:hypothetical protein